MTFIFHTYIYIYINMYISDSIHFLNIYSLEFIYQFTISMVFYFL